MHPIERLRWIARAEGESSSTLAVEAAYSLAELARHDPAAVVTACRRLLDAHPRAGPIWWAASRILGAADLDAEAYELSRLLAGDETPQWLASGLVELSSRDGRSDPGPTVVVASPLEELAQVVDCLEASAFAGSLSVRLVGLAPSVRSDLAHLDAAGIDAAGFSLDEISPALDGADLVVVGVLGASPGGAAVTSDAALVIEAAQRDERASTAGGGLRWRAQVWGVAGVGRVLPRILVLELARKAGDGAEILSPGLFDLVAGPFGLEEPARSFERSTCPPATELVAG